MKVMQRQTLNQTIALFLGLMIALITVANSPALAFFCKICVLPVAVKGTQETTPAHRFTPCLQANQNRHDGASCHHVGTEDQDDIEGCDICCCQFVAWLETDSPKVSSTVWQTPFPSPDFALRINPEPINPPPRRQI